MALTLIAGPQVLPLSLEDAKLHLAVEHSDHDGMITQLIKTAVNHMDGSSGWLGRALVEQTWELRLDRFPPCIAVPLPPLISVEEIKYLDAAGELTTLAEDAYVVEPGGLRPALITPAFNTCFPSVRGGRGCVRVTFKAGFAQLTDDSPADLDYAAHPSFETVIEALKLQVEVYYCRDPDMVPVLQQTVDALMAPLRVGGVA